MKFGVQSVHIRIVQVGIQKFRNNRGQFVPQLKIPCSENLDKSRDVVCKAPRNVGNELVAPIVPTVDPILVVSLTKNTHTSPSWYVAVFPLAVSAIRLVGHGNCVTVSRLSDNVAVKTPP